MDLSLVIPVFNEEESLPPLIAEIHGTLATSGWRYEIICVDDGSRDRSVAVLEALAATDETLVVAELRRNFGQTAAMQAGLDAARGAVIVTLDADLQNDPRDIPTLVQMLDDGPGYDLAAGWRADRKDPFWTRRLPSITANRLISQVTGVRLHDHGCTLRAMRAEVAKELRLYGEMHRFIPALAAAVGARICEAPVNHRARQFGDSKYGLDRTVRVALDLMTVLFTRGFLARPIQVFGLWGLVLWAAGAAIGGYLLFALLVLDATPPLALLVLIGVLAVGGVQLIATGLVAEVLGRTYFESQGRRPYHVRRWIGRADADADADSISKPAPAAD